MGTPIIKTTTLSLTVTMYIEQEERKDPCTALMETFPDCHRNVNPSEHYSHRLFYFFLHTLEVRVP